MNITRYIPNEVGDLVESDQGYVVYYDDVEFLIKREISYQQDNQYRKNLERRRKKEM